MKIDIIASLDSGYFFGLLATVNSIFQNTSQPEKLRFNVIIPEGETEFFEQNLEKHFSNTPFEFRVKEFFPSTRIREYVTKKYNPPSIKRANAIYMLFSRLYLREIFPDLKKILYLDTDIVVIQDIAELYNSIDFSADQYFAAVTNIIPAMLHFSNPLKALSELRKFKSTFNAGVLFTDLSFWTNADYERLEYYLRWDEECNYRLFQLNDETILNLMFKDYLPLDPKWNCSGFGNAKLISWFLKKELSKIAIIHWSGGHHKPWSSKNIPYADIWQKYAILES